MRFWGEIIEKTGQRAYRLTNGGFTSCIQPTPRWEVRASSVDIDLDEYARLRSMLLVVKGVPLFYLPFMYYPIQDDDRATGLLMPTYGASTVQGQSISSAFFWAINRSHDAHRLPRLADVDRPGHGGRVPLRARAELARRCRGLPAERKRDTRDRPVHRRRDDPAGPTQLPASRPDAARLHGRDPGARQRRLLLGRGGAADVRAGHLRRDQQLAHVRRQRDGLLGRVHPERHRRLPGDLLRAGRLVAPRVGTARLVQPVGAAARRAARLLRLLQRVRQPAAETELRRDGDGLGTDAVRRQSAGAGAVHALAVPDVQRVGRLAPDPLAGEHRPGDDGADRRPRLAVRHRARDRDHRPRVRQDLGHAEHRLLGTDEARHRAVDLDRAHHRGRQLRADRQNRQHRLDRRRHHAAALRGGQPALRATGGAGCAGVPDRRARADLLHRRAGVAVRPAVPDQLPADGRRATCRRWP